MALSLGTDLEDPRTQAILALGLGLLGSRGSFASSLSEAGQQAMGVYNAGRQRQDAAQTQALQRALLQGQVDSLPMQQEVARMQLEQQRREFANQQALAEAARRRVLSPQQAAMAGGGGPTPAAAAAGAAPGAQGGFDSAGFINDAFGIDPMKAMDIQAKLAKDNSPIAVKEGETLLDRRTMKPVFANQKQPELPTTVREFQFGLQNPGFNPWLVGRQSAGATRVSVPVNTERTYAGTVADALAKQDADAIDAARSAPERVRVARQVKAILGSDKPITGTLAEQRLAINKALATAGVIDGTQAAATEALASTLASQALAAIKTSGLGAGAGFSNADRDFLERAAAGKIDMTPGALLRIADLNERSALRSIERGNRVINRLRVNPSLGSVAGALEPVESPTVERLPTAAEIEAEKRRRGIK